MPRTALTPIMHGTEYILADVTENEPGYSPCPSYGFFRTRPEAAEAADTWNMSFGVSPGDAVHIIASSMAAQNLAKRQAKLPILEALAAGLIDGEREEADPDQYAGPALSAYRIGLYYAGHCSADRANELDDLLRD